MLMLMGLMAFLCCGWHPWDEFGIVLGQKYARTEVQDVFNAGSVSFNEFPGSPGSAEFSFGQN